MATTKKSAAKKTAPKTSAKNTIESTADQVTEQANTVFASVKENISNARALAQKIWFANLGMYGRTYEEIQTRFTKLNDEVKGRYADLTDNGQELVKDLVARGEKVQDEAETLLKEGRATLEEQIEVAKGRLTEVTPIADISARLKELSAKLESLSKDLKKAA
jgi:transcriptional regulator of heat shock response